MCPKCSQAGVCRYKQWASQCLGVTWKCPYGPGFLCCSMTLNFSDIGSHCWGKHKSVCMCLHASENLDLAGPA